MHHNIMRCEVKGTGLLGSRSNPLCGNRAAKLKDRILGDADITRIERGNEEYTQESSVPQQ